MIPIRPQVWGIGLKFEELLGELHRRGVEVRVENQELQFQPQSAVTGELRDAMREHRLSLLDRVQPAEFATGCQIHANSSSQVETWWGVAARSAADVTVCACCAGPAPRDSLVCLKCAPLDPEVHRALISPRKCVLCAENGYTIRWLGWVCRGCLSAQLGVTEGSA